MKIYPIYITPQATKFYLVADDRAEMERIDDRLPAHRPQEEWMSRTSRFAEAARNILGLSGDERRFVRANYESDGIWCCKLFGPANDRLFAELGLEPTFEGDATERILVQYLEPKLKEAMLPNDN